MLQAAFKYAYPNARTRALRGRRLTSSDFHYLIKAKDIHTFLSYLATTSYGRYLPEYQGRAVARNLAHLERALSRPLLEHYFKIFRTLKDKHSAQLIKALFARFEVENLKILIRAKFSGLERRNVEHLLYPLPRLTQLPWQRLWDAVRIKDLAKILERTAYGRSIKNAYPQFEAQARTFPLEMALDIACYENIVRAVHSLRSRNNRRRITNLIGNFVDIQNIMLALRLRFTYALSPEETVNYSLPGGKALDLKRLHKIARAKDLHEFITALPRPFKQALAGATEIRQIRTSLHDFFLRMLHKSFHGLPFHLGVEVAYLLEKEMELKALVSLYQAKKEGLPPPAAEKLVPSHFLAKEKQYV